MLSHPAWVCGLKLFKWRDSSLRVVTPCVGVWIETRLRGNSRRRCPVTPCVGVWIETLIVVFVFCSSGVTPCVGVWIETRILRRIRHGFQSHPAWVCGLKPQLTPKAITGGVTPCVGVWIETLFWGPA